MKKRVLVTILIALALLTGCVNEKAEHVDKNELTILITKDFGREILSEKTLLVNEEDTVMDLMLDNFDIETAYGGGFVNAIGGLASGYTKLSDKQENRTKMDWFYYVNGIMAEVGSDQYYANDVNTISWDFHDWGGDMYVKTRINAWPHRLKGKDVEISWSDDAKAEAAKVRTLVENSGGILIDRDLESIDMDNLDMDAIFIGSWEDASKNEFIRNAVENRDRAGIYTVFNDEGFSIYNNTGNKIGSYEAGAAIIAIQKAYGSEASILLIVGNNNNLVKEAVDIFMDGGDMKGKFALAVTEDGVYDAP